ncbi:cytochrome P450 [Nakamurella flava]|uniref:cytochrome P450 n=1 Tax=Nakamurella flava TaxID=2576308 RepID=UPI001F10A896|nr:cytochrome P450 [Nakamurella flava]
MLPPPLDPDLPRAEDFGFDPADAAFCADPYPVFALLRAAGPVVTYAPRGLYLLPRYAEVHAALRDRRLGRAFAHRYTPAEFGQPEFEARWPRWEESERWSLLNLEPPDHTRLRRLVTAVFTARSVARLEPRITELAAAHLDRAVEIADAEGSFDLIADYAQPYSVAVICTLLGVPVADGPRLLDWSHAIVKMYELHRTPAQEQAAERAADEFLAYVTDLLVQRRARPADDLITALAEVADSGDRLTDDEILGTVIVLLNAGHEATVNTLGNGVRALLSHRDQWHRLTDGLVEPATAVEEMIRWDAPLQLFERWVLDDGVEFGGRRFAVGERIGMLFGSANRDPSRFPEPDAFLVDRGDATHIGFGGGLHFCIGAPLARLELGCSLLQLIQRCPGLRMVEDPVFHPSFVIHGLEDLRLAPSSA